MNNPEQEKVDLIDKNQIVLDLANLWQYIAKHFTPFAQYLPFFFQKL